jgi:ribosome-associated protein
MTTHDDHWDDELPKSKSQLKREMHDLQGLGKQLMTLGQEQLNRLPMSEALRAALIESDRIRQHEARRRHLQYVGKVIRQEEHLDDLATAVAAFDTGSAEHTRRQHLAERWRDRLIEEGDPVVAELIDYAPAMDVQHLRNLTRNARRDAKTGKNTGHARKLFRFLREHIDAQEGAA